MRMIVALLVAAVACGGTKHVEPKPEPKPQPPPPTPPPEVAKKPDPPPPPPAKPSCATIATKLIDERGFGKIPEPNREGARRGGEAEIIASCLDDRWPDATIECMTTRPSAASCLGQLSQYQQKAYDAHLRDWERNWAKNDADPGEEENATEKTKPPPKREEWVSCELGVPAEFAPVIAAKAHARELALALRARALETACYRWANPDKKCFNAARDAVAIDACRKKLDDASRNTLDNLLAEADGEVKRIAALEKNAKAIDCKTIAAFHYGDDAWKGHLVSLSPAERKRVAAESRTKLTKSCTDEKWTATERACIVSRASPSEHDMMECFPAKKFSFKMRWGYPAAGVTFKTGIAECDELETLVKKIASCDKFDKDMREMILDSWAMEVSRWLEWHGSRDDIVKSCKQTAQLYSEGAKERGCTI
jgi:hypothetical protein